MPTWSHVTAAVMVFSLTLGVLLAIPMAARADDKPIVGPIIIHKDPPKPSKGEVAAADLSGT